MPEELEFPFPVAGAVVILLSVLQEHPGWAELVEQEPVIATQVVLLGTVVAEAGAVVAQRLLRAALLLRVEGLEPGTGPELMLQPIVVEVVVVQEHKVVVAEAKVGMVGLV